MVLPPIFETSKIFVLQITQQLLSLWERDVSSKRRKMKGWWGFFDHGAETLVLVWGFFGWSVKQARKMLINMGEHSDGV